MKKLLLIALQVFVVLSVIALFVFAYWGVNVRYQEYEQEYDSAEVETKLEIISITFNENGYMRVECANGKIYKTSKIAFDEDVTQPTLLLEKLEKISKWRFALNSSVWVSNNIYKATIYMAQPAERD